METVRTSDDQFPEDNNNGRLTCNLCQRSFGRLEHLKRHVLTHTKERQFHCSRCGKDFFRRDALQRHELTHTSTAPSLLRRGVRACTGCAVAKARCSGELPCGRCQQRQQTCEYPRSRTSVSQSDRTVYTPTQGIETPFLHSTSNVSTSERMATNPRPDVGGPTSTSAYYHTASTDDIMPISTVEDDIWNTNMLSTINWLNAEEVTFDFGTEPVFLPYNSQLQAPFLDSLSISRETANSGSIDLRPSEVAPSPAVSHGESLLSATSFEIDNDQRLLHQAPRAGEYYVDGEAARLPRTKRRKTSSKASNPRTPACQQLSLDTSMQVSSLSYWQLPHTTYGSLREAFVQLCLNGRHGYASFSTDSFPSNAVFASLIEQYFEAFHPTLPMQHRPTFMKSEPHYSLVLAMSFIGTSFVDDNQESGAFAASLFEFLHRVIQVGQTDQSLLPKDQSTSAQVKLLYVIGASYGQIGVPYTSAVLQLRFELSEYVAKLHSTSASSTLYPTPHDDHESMFQMQRWCELQIKSRTAYSIWLVDCMWSFHFRGRSLLTLEHAKLPLPCHERLWCARDEVEWKTVATECPSTPSLLEALQKLYVDKKLAPELGEFSRILLIHGLIRRTSEVGAYFGQGLSSWEPTSQRQSSEQLEMSKTRWLPSILTYTKWRNSACDCLDVLHWSANSTIGAASGMEHPTVMHLHLSRVVILTPYANIVNLALYLAGSASSSDTADGAIVADREAIRKWAHSDQYKARLAMIHAGVMFWNIRRYSANAFYEPTSVVLSTLALWAFSAFSNKSSRAPSRDQVRAEAANHGQSKLAEQSESSDDVVCDIILLDRPTDDELVQQFVRRGHTMRANITGVGDLYGLRGPEKVLVEGRKLLASLQFWEIRHTWLAVFDKLIIVSRQQRQTQGN